MFVIKEESIIRELTFGGCIKISFLTDTDQLVKIHIYRDGAYSVYINDHDLIRFNAYKPNFKYSTDKEDKLETSLILKCLGIVTI